MDEAEKQKAKDRMLASLREQLRAWSLEGIPDGLIFGMLIELSCEAGIVMNDNNPTGTIAARPGAPGGYYASTRS